MALAMATDVAEAELLLLPRCHENHARHDTPAAHAHPVANRLATTTSVGYSSPTPRFPAWRRVARHRLWIAFRSPYMAWLRLGWAYSFDSWIGLAKLLVRHIFS